MPQRKKTRRTASVRKRRQRKNNLRSLRRGLITLALFVIIGYLCYPWVKSLLHQDPLPTGDYQGIDVSKHQGTINWQVVARDKNIQFVYIKATEGASVVDKRYVRNLREAREAGLKVGSYHFFRGYKSPEEQFALFRRYVKKEEQDLLPMVDVEELGNRHVDRKRLQSSLSQFMELIKKEYGHYPLLYSQYRFYNQMLAPEFNKYYIFMARYGNRKPHLKGGGKYNVWQYTEKGKIEGIKGYVDLDRFANGTTLRDISL